MFSSLCSVDLCPTRSLCFHSFSWWDWFVASSYEFDEKKQLDHESTIKFSLIDSLFLLLFHKSNRALFLWVHWRNKPLGTLGVHWQSFSRFLFQHPCGSKPIERVIYCLNKIYFHRKKSASTQMSVNA